SGGDLKSESSTDADGVSLGNIGGVRADAWVAYRDMNFGDDLPEKVTVRYVNNSGRGPADSSVQVRLNAPDGPVVDTIALPHTGSNWSAYETVEHELADPSLLEDAGTIYFVFTGSTTSSHPWIGNFDWFRFDGAEDDAPVVTARIEAESFTDSNGGGLKSETSTDDAGNTIGNVGGTWDGGVLTYSDVDLSARD